MTPDVSIVVPMRNAEKYIDASLNSVLEEEDVPLEVIIVDDQSTDASSDKVKSIGDHRVRLIKGTGQGISATLNLALSVTQGEIIMRCDADDMFTSGRISRQVSWLRTNTSFGAVCGGFTTLDSRGREVTNLPTGDSAAEITQELNRGVTRTHLCSFAIRRSVVDKVGGFRPYFITAEDIDYQLRLAEVTRVMYLPGSCYLYRLHEDSITHKQNQSERIFFEDMAREFLKQRVDSGFDDLERKHPPASPGTGFDSPGKASDQIAGLLMGRAWLEHEKGRKSDAIRYGVRALREKPGDLNQWKSFIALIVK